MLLWLLVAVITYKVVVTCNEWDYQNGRMVCISRYIVYHSIKKYVLYIFAIENIVIQFNIKGK